MIPFPTRARDSTARDWARAKTRLDLRLVGGTCSGAPNIRYGQARSCPACLECTVDAVTPPAPTPLGRVTDTAAPRAVCESTNWYHSKLPMSVLSEGEPQPVKQQESFATRSDRTRSHARRRCPRDTRARASTCPAVLWGLGHTVPQWQTTGSLCYPKA